LVVCIIGLFGFMQALGQSKKQMSKQATIWLGSTELTIGMPRDAAIARLAQLYEVEKMEDDGSWLVQDKGIHDKDHPPHLVGTVSFTNESLISVNKFWGPEDQHRGAEFAQSLYGAIASLVNSGKTGCHISVGENQQPTGESKIAFISCGDRFIRVDIIRRPQIGEVATLTEVLKPLNDAR
jgi:hypothetical protein